MPKGADFQQELAFQACNSLDGELQSFCNEAIQYKIYSLEKSFDLYIEDSS